MRRAVWIGGVAVGVLLAASVAKGAPETLDSYAVAVPASEPNRVVVFSADSLGREQPGLESCHSGTGACPCAWPREQYHPVRVKWITSPWFCVSGLGK